MKIDDAIEVQHEQANLAFKDTDHDYTEDEQDSHSENEELTHNHNMKTIMTMKAQTLIHAMTKPSTKNTQTQYTFMRLFL